MKTTKRFIPLLLLIVIILFSGGIAYSGTSVETTGGLAITVDPNASGTKLFGPLTVYYERLDRTGCIYERTNMIFFVRLKKGTSIYGFSGRADSICTEDTTSQEQAIRAFFANTVIPYLFPTKPNAPFALKSVAQIVADDQINFGGSPYFTTLDIEIAVKE